MDHEDRPVATGLLALLGVGLVVGILVSGAALGASKFFGLGDGGSGGTATAQQSMILPEPVATPKDDKPQITLAPQPRPGEISPGDGNAVPQTGGAPTVTPSAATAITLAASSAQARAGEMITLSGTYPGGEGATLAVERLIGGTWTSFADVTTSVSGDTFSTYVRTSQTGPTTFRVRDVATNTASNEVAFTIS